MKGIDVAKPSTHNRRHILGGLLFVFAIVVFCASAIPVKAATFSDGERRDIEKKFGPVYHWLVRSWSDQSILCEVFVEKKRQVTGEDIHTYCKARVYEDWLKTPACSDAANEQKSKSCAGVYLVNLGEHVENYEKVQLLPPAEAHFELTNCKNGQWCLERPEFRIYGVEPVSTFKITEVHIRIGARTTVCRRSDQCFIQVPTTTERGAAVEYWVVSSFGDETKHQIIQMRNVYQFGPPTQYFLEVLSPTINNNSAELQWRSFPSLNQSDAQIYSSRVSLDQLNTENHLFYLSGKLINSGAVDTQACGGGILLTNGNAGACGEDAAYQQAIRQQNQFNQQILNASQKYGLPPLILKGIITQESQFWQDPNLPNEYGLGSLTERGVDSLLITDTQGFLKVCIPIYGEKTCSAGYSALNKDRKAFLRGALLRQVGTDQEVDLIARVLMSQVIQVGQLVTTATKNPPGQVSTYEDLWDLSIASYHAGSGCVEQTLDRMQKEKQTINFENFCSAVTQGCKSACTFTEKVKGYVR